MKIDKHEVEVNECHTDKADYMVYFYKGDISESEVLDKIPEAYRVVDRKLAESDRIIELYIEQSK